jgi:hypothetical protein
VGPAIGFASLGLLALLTLIGLHERGKDSRAKLLVLGELLNQEVVLTVTLGRVGLRTKVGVVRRVDKHTVEIQLGNGKDEVVGLTAIRSVGSGDQLRGQW